jgi:futalosine hydrolase
MEGASAAHLCRLYDVPFLEVRGISNLVQERRRHLWDLPLAADRAQRAALRLIETFNL